jgi:hypothetical protein
LTDLEVDQAAINEQFGAGGIGRIGREVEGCGSDFGGGAGATERNAGPEIDFKVIFRPP